VTVSDSQAEQTRLTLLVLLGVAIAYSAVGIVSTCLIAAAGRRREFALLRLAGATPRQILRIVSGESLLLALAGTGLAAGVSAVIVGGLHIAYSSLTGAAPVRLPWLLLSGVAAGAVFTAVAASALTTYFSRLRVASRTEN
jgi:putative ABC transport system permease protein